MAVNHPWDWKEAWDDLDLEVSSPESYQNCGMDEQKFVMTFFPEFHPSTCQPYLPVRKQENIFGVIIVDLVLFKDLGGLYPMFPTSWKELGHLQSPDQQLERKSQLYWNRKGPQALVYEVGCRRLQM